MDAPLDPRETASTVLIVDDDHPLREALRDLMAEEGFRPLVACNGAEALEIIRRESPPFLILLDLMMPVMDGWQFQAALEKSPELLKVPVIIISDHVQSRVIAGARGVRFFVRKPVAVPELLAYVDRYRAS
ncbi:MAG: response regulator [Thermoanaerobaculia bacterium]